MRKGEDSEVRGPDGMEELTLIHKEETKEQNHLGRNNIMS